MWLKSIRVHENWQERMQLAQAAAASRWRAALIAVLLSLVLALSIQALPYMRASNTLLPDGAVSALYLVVGVALVARLPNSWKWRLAFAYPLLIIGVLLADWTIHQAVSNQSENALLFLLYFTFTMGALIVPGWALIGFALYRTQVRPPLAKAWWLRQIIFGLGGGCIVALLLVLSEYFGGINISLSPPSASLLVERLVYALGLRSPGEEIVFRGILFEYLYFRLGKGFWTAIFITLPLNLAIYIVQMPHLTSPQMAASALVGPAMMAIASSVLYVSKRSLIASTINNSIFQVISFAMGLR